MQGEYSIKERHSPPSASGQEPAGTKVRRNASLILRTARADWIAKGLINNNTKINFGLIAGKVAKSIQKINYELALQNHIQSMGWFFWGPTKIKEKVMALQGLGYENKVSTLVAKLLK